MMGMAKEAACMKCVHEEKYRFANATAIGLPNLSDHKDTLWASIQVLTGAVRFTEDGTTVTTATGELVTASDTTNPPRIWLESYTTGLPLENISILSSAGTPADTYIILKYFTKE